MTERTCTIQDCDRPLAGRGLCRNHYMKWRRNGDPTLVIGRGRQSPKVPSKTCSVEGCSGLVYTLSRNLCRSHNVTWLKYGQTTVPPEATLTRFMAFVQKCDSGCWEWQGARAGTGAYGQFSMKAEGGKRSAFAHRVAWEIMRGPIPEGLTIDHLCRNTICVNPDHLEPVTQAENTARQPRRMRRVS